MSEVTQSILERAMRLSDVDRGLIAEQLLASLDSANGDYSTWASEIQLRLDEVRSGKSKPIPWDEARQQILEDGDGDAC